MKKIVILIALFMALALGLSVLGSFGDLPGKWSDTDTNVDTQRYQISGVWGFNETLTFSEKSITENVRFSVHVTVDGIDFVCYCNKLDVDAFDERIRGMGYQTEPEGVFGENVVWDWGVGYVDGSWLYGEWGDKVNIFDFGTKPQTVSKEFYDWLIVNAAPYVEEEPEDPEDPAPEEPEDPEDPTPEEPEQPTYPDGYLFYEEVITEGSNYNFPAPVVGVTYTLVVNGEDWRTTVYDGSDYFMFGGEDYKLYYATSENYYNAGVGGGVYSLRIDNVPEEPEDPTPEEPTEQWLFQNEYIGSDGRGDLPPLIEGATYSMFIDGEFWETYVYDGSGVFGAGIRELRFENGWYYNDEVGFVYSLRIDSVPEDPTPEEPEQPTYPDGYLFYEEVITEEPRYDLPLLVEGATYTAFVDGSVRTFTYTSAEVLGDGFYYIGGEGSDPVYNPSDGSWRMDAGTYVVSIRIDNVPAVS